MYAAAWLCYGFALVALVALVRPRPVRMNPAGATQVGIAAFNPGPVGTSGTLASKPAPAQPVRKPQPTQTTRANSAAKDRAAESSEGTGAAAGAQGAGTGSGPVNLGTGAGLTLLKKVVPLYPRVMEQARMPGTVVLDAIIHRDGSIGDVTLKSATNEAFAQAAIDAVKQWRYTPIPYEGIVTVTVNFSPR
jgi:TonB family protein